MGVKLIVKCEDVFPVIERSLACSRIFGIGLPFQG